MTEYIVVFLFSFSLLNWKLQLALNFPHKQIVNDNIVGWIVQFIFNSDEFELAPHSLTAIKHVHRSKYANKTALATLQFRTKNVTYFKDNQIDILVFLVCVYILTSFQKMMDEDVGVAEHEGGKNCVYFRG